MDAISDSIRKMIAAQIISGASAAAKEVEKYGAKVITVESSQLGIYERINSSSETSK